MTDGFKEVRFRYLKFPARGSRIIAAGSPLLLLKIFSTADMSLLTVSEVAASGTLEESGSPRVATPLPSLTRKGSVTSPKFDDLCHSVKSTSKAHACFCTRAYESNHFDARNSWDYHLWQNILRKTRSARAGSFLHCLSQGCKNLQISAKSMEKS